MKEAIYDQLRNQLDKLYRMEFYRDKLNKAGIKPSEIRRQDDFTKIPFTTSQELLKELKKKPSQCSLYSQNVTRVNFSPSGSDLYPVYHTKDDIERMCEACRPSLEAAGITENDICAVTFGYHIFVAGLFYQTQLEYYGAKVMPIGPGESERTAKLIDMFNVSVLVANPTFAMKIAEKGVSSVRVLFVGGEPFTCVDGYSERIRRAFGKDLTVIDSYSMALCLPVARSCRFEKGLHLVDDFVYAEIVDPLTGQILDAGEKGELVLTHINKDAVPLLRYRTGDLTFIEKKRCECGRELTFPKGILGRTDEMIKVKGVKFWPSQVGNILREFSGLTGRYRVVVHSGKGTDTITLIVEQKKGGDVRPETVQSRLKQETLVSPNKIILVEELGEGPLVIHEGNGRAL